VFREVAGRLLQTPKSYASRSWTCSSRDGWMARTPIAQMLIATITNHAAAKLTVD
jgi:hypothetical protein